jgi:hypothetical protein
VTADIFTTPAAPIELGTQRQLFLDDRVVASLAGARRAMGAVTRHGPVLRPETAAGEVAIQSRTAPQWNAEASLWEWWYWGNHSCAPYGPWASTSIALCKYATSQDGLNWQRPALGLHRHGDSCAANICMDPEAGHRALYHCMRDGRTADPAERYKGMLGQHQRVPAVSADGMTWRELDCEPLRSSDESTLLFDPIADQFVAIVKQGTVWGRSMAVVTSPDFQAWSDHGVVIHADDTDWAGRMGRIREVAEDPRYVVPPLIDDDDFIAETYNLSVHPYEGLYVGLVNIFDKAGAIPPPQMNHTGLNQIQLAVSRDLLHWRRLADRATFLGVQPWDGEAYDTQQLLPAGAPVLVDDTIRIYYNAARFRGHRELFPERYHSYFDDTTALCLATVRRDGYLSLRADDTAAELMTRPLAVAGAGTLRVNAVLAAGELRAAVLDADTCEALPGFTDDDCTPVTGDQLRATMSWRGGNLAAAAAAGPVRLRCRWRDGDFYAFWADQPD